MGFDWDEANIAHIARHGVTQEEAEEVIENDPLELKPQLIEGEERFPNIGLTDTGRWLVVVLTERGTKARVVTAFEADKDLIALYIREKWGKQ
ncbi:MAG: BrnT family toxin [Acidobacteriia bacterium]|nr:BrnT family toxin [Terriglobia bacterium]